MTKFQAPNSKQIQNHNFQIIKILILVILVIGIYLGFGIWDLGFSAEIQDIAPIAKDDRILILAPHPDDEAISCAGIIQEAVRKGAKVHVAYLTNGDHNQFAFIVYEKRLVLRKGAFVYMGEVRRQEAIKAMKWLGLKESDLTFLGYPDFGTLAIFRERWRDAHTYKNLLTRISSVPYKEDLSYGAPYKGESILADVKTVIRTFRPTKIFVSHPVDSNVDHKTFYLFLEVALADLKKEIGSPEVYTYLVHAARWPKPRGYKPQKALVPPQPFNPYNQWLKFHLDEQAIEKKRIAVVFYKSQTSVSASYLLSFVRANELFAKNLPICLEKSQEKSSGNYFDLYADSFAGLWDKLYQLAEGYTSINYALDGDDLLVKVYSPEGLSERFSLMVYLFGYNSAVAFSDMPKIRIQTLHKRFKVFNQRKLLKSGPGGVSLSFAKKQLVLRVPLKFLGNPEFILSSAKAYTGKLPVTFSGFQRIDISDAQCELDLPRSRAILGAIK